MTSGLCSILQLNNEVLLCYKNAGYKIAVELLPVDRRANRRLARLETKRNALEGIVLGGADFVEVMDSRGKISSNMPLLLTGPALRYRIAFVNNSSQLQPAGIRQLAAIGQAMQSASLKYVRFEILLMLTRYMEILYRP